MANILTWVTGDFLSTVRQKINDNFIGLNRDGNYLSATAPAAPVAGQTWTDTTAGVIKRRNAANTTWLYVERIRGAGVLDVTTNRTVLPDDYGRVLRCSGSALILALPSPSAVGEGWYIEVKAEVNVMLTPSAGLVDGLSLLLVPAGYYLKIYSTGSAFFTDLHTTFRTGSYTVNIATANVDQPWSLSFSPAFSSACLSGLANGAANSMGSSIEVAGITSTGLSGFIRKPTTGNITFRYIAVGK